MHNDFFSDTLMRRTNEKIPPVSKGKEEPTFYQEYDGRCGHWQQAYRQYTSAIDQLPPKLQRLAVFSTKRSGLCDRLTSAVTIFYVALLSKRAFKIDWKNLEPLESVFDQPNINWSIAHSDMDPNLGVVKIRRYHTQKLVPEWHPMNDYFSRENLTHLDSDVRTLAFELNQGQIWTLFENPHHKRDLEAMGLTPETAFGCAMHFLFTPRLETLAIAKETWQEIWPYVSERKRKLVPHSADFDNSKYATELLIGVQVRLGDFVFKSNSARCKTAFDQDAFTRSIFKCADYLSDSINVPTKFLLITDCVDIRWAAKEYYGDRLITYLSGDTEVGHVERTRSLETLRLATSELWLFSMTDYQIITRDSSFGRVGAFLSLGWHQIHTMYPGKNYTECDIFNFSQWQELRSDFTKI